MYIGLSATTGRSGCLPRVRPSERPGTRSEPCGRGQPERRTVALSPVFCALNEPARVRLHRSEPANKHCNAPCNSGKSRTRDRPVLPLAAMLGSTPAAADGLPNPRKPRRRESPIQASSFAHRCDFVGKRRAGAFAVQRCRIACAMRATRCRCISVRNMRGSTKSIALRAPRSGVVLPAPARHGHRSHGPQRIELTRLDRAGGLRHFSLSPSTLLRQKG